MNCDKPYCTFALTVLASAWLLLAAFVGETALLESLPAPAIPIILWSLVALLLTAFWKNRPFRAFVDDLSLRVLLALHLTRFVGVYFLYLAAHGELPKSFAIAAGWGDILVATGALILMFRPAPNWIFAWNILGLLDIIYVVGHAALHLLTKRETMLPFTSLPLSFLPTLIVPLIIFSHIAVFIRLWPPTSQPFPQSKNLSHAKIRAAKT